MINIISVVMVLIPATITVVSAFLLVAHYLSTEGEEAVYATEGGLATKPWWQTWIEPEAVLAWSAFSLALIIASLHS